MTAGARSPDDEGDVVDDRCKQEPDDELAGVEACLTPQESALLRVLAAQPGRVWPRDDLARAVYAADLCAADLLIDVQVAALRRKLRRAAPGRRWIDIVGTSYAFVA